MNNYVNILCIHPKDSSTDFLKPIGEIFSNEYIIVEPSDEDHKLVLDKIESLESNSLIVFLGHGTESVLYGAFTKTYEKKTFINESKAKIIFANKDVFLLSCYSSPFLKSTKKFNKAIGFGNIVSSTIEIISEAEVTGVFRSLESEDINIFNDTYVLSIKTALKFLILGRIDFNQLHYYICYFLNKEISRILLNKGITNRKEIAKMLFDLRDEMLLFS